MPVSGVGDFHREYHREYSWRHFGARGCALRGS